MLGGCLGTRRERLCGLIGAVSAPEAAASFFATCIGPIGGLECDTERLVRAA